MDRLTLAVAMLVVWHSAPEVQGQPRSRPGTSGAEVRSLFGSRSLGWPVLPKPRDFGGGDAFGPRPNFRRGFSPSVASSSWGERAPEPVSSDQENVQFGPAGGQPAQTAAPWGVPIEPPAQVAEQAGQQSVTPSAQPEAGVAMAGEGLAGGVAGEVGTGAQVAPSARRPSFQWNRDSIRPAPPESILGKRLRSVLGNRLRSPLAVSIQDETAILRGAVATEHDRALAGHLARFEPGVRSVRNELVVAASSPD